MVSNGKEIEVLISLLARLAWGENKIREAVLLNKKNPSKYIEGYNACNGTNGVTDIAKIIGVSQPNMTNILKDWENLGIVYNVGEVNRPRYKKILFLRE